MRPGGKFVVFHLNTAPDTSSTTDTFGALGEGLSGLENKADVYYAGSRASVRVARDFRAAIAQFQNGHDRSIARDVVALFTVVLRALIANRAEATTPNELPFLLGPWLSVTVVVRSDEVDRMPDTRTGPMNAADASGR